MRRNIRTFLLISLIFTFVVHGQAQFSLQGYSTGVTGGISESTRYRTEISTGEIGIRPRGENYSFYLGLAAANLESAIVSVNATNTSDVTITEDTDGYLLRIRPSGNYDTLGRVNSNAGGEFDFASAFHGNYLVVVDSDPEKYVPTYYGNSFLWNEADILVLSKDTLTEITVNSKPRELTSNDGDGLVRGTIEEDFKDSEDGRIDARRRAAKRKCGLRKRRRGGRTDQDEDEYELIAYGETNSNGEFEYGFLPEGTYRFFVEYPGIPMDESSFVEFDVGEAGVSDNEFVLAAIVTEDGITVELILGITDEVFTNFNIYPNPTLGKISINFSQMLIQDLTMEVIDMNGRTIISRKVENNENKRLEIDLSSQPTGQYILKFHDNAKSKTALTFRVIKN